MLVKNFWRLFGLALLISAGGLSAAAAQDYPNPGNAQLNLKLTVAEGCHFTDEDTGSTIVFTQVTNLDKPLPKDGSFSIKCTAGYSGNKSIKVTLNAGNFPGDTITARKLHFESDSSETIDFQVFIRGTRTVWGDGTQGSEPIQVDLAKDGANLVGSGDYTVELSEQKLDGKFAGTYSNILQLGINYQ